MTFKINGIISINETTATETPSTLVTKLTEPKGYNIRFQLTYGAEKIMSRNFCSKDLSWEQLEINEDGMVVSNWIRHVYKNTWQANLENDVHLAVENIIISDKNPEFVLFGGMARLVKYCLKHPESSEAQEVLIEVNGKIEWLNYVAKLVSHRIGKPVSHPTTTMSAADIAAMGAVNAVATIAEAKVPTLQEDPKQACSVN
jgi:hypothetical protein